MSTPHINPAAKPGPLDALDDARLGRLGTAALLALTALAYLPALRNGFVWDDPRQILGNLYTDSLANIPAIFATDVWSTAGVEVADRPYYRPLLITSFALDRALWGTSALGHHLQSLLWHLGAVAVVSGLLRALVPVVPALIGAALFALHPMNSEAVAWVSARNDPMAALLCAGAAWALLPLRPSAGRLAAGALLLLGGLLSKESAVMAGLLVLGLDLARHGDPRTWLREGWARYAAMTASVCVWFGLRMNAGIGGGDALSASRVGRVLEDLPTILGFYGRALVWPWPLTIARRLGDLQEPLALTVLGWCVGLVGVAVALRRGRGLAAAGLLFAAVTFGPTLLGMGATHQVGDRYLYMPLIGVALALAASLPSHRALLGWATLCAMPALVALQLRLPEWESDLSLAEAQVEDYPGAVSYGAMGFALQEAGQPAEAAPWFARSLEAAPLQQQVCRPALDNALKLAPDDAARFVDLTRSAGCPREADDVALETVLLARAGRWEQARAQLPAARGGAEALWVPVAAALARMDGDEALYVSLRARIAQGAEAEARFDAWVQALTR